MAALMFAAVLFNINASALTSQEYEQEILGLLYDLKNGYITPEQYEQYENEVTTRFIESNTDSNGVVDTVAENIANTVKSITEGIGEAVQKTGDNFKDWLSDIFDDFETQEEIPTIDLQGNGALIVATKSNGYVYKQYCEYVILEINDTYPAGRYVPKNTTSAMVYTTDGRSWESTQNAFPVKDYQSVQVYGDVRYENGETAPSTEIPTTSDTVFNIDELSDNELDELLKDILEELERQNPDLSTIEGLLESIYYRLGALDSDNDNALLSDINTSILALANDSSNEEMIEILLEIRDGLKNGDSGTSEDENTDEDSGETGDSSGTSDGHPDHICGTVYNVKPLDKNWLNKLFTDATELKVEYQGSKYYLQSCGCLLLDDKYYSVDMNYDSYTNIDYDFSNDDIIGGFEMNDGTAATDFDFGSEYANNGVSTYSMRSSTASTSWFDRFSETQQDKVNNTVDMIEQSLEIGVPFELIMESTKTFEGILFTETAPQDLTINLFDKEVVILSASFFDTSELTPIVEGGINRGGGGSPGNREDAIVTNRTMKIVRDLTSVFIGVAWVLNMRRKVTNMI